MPTGVTVAAASKSWSAAEIRTRLLPPGRGHAFRWLWHPSKAVTCTHRHLPPHCAASLEQRRRRSREVFLGLALGHVFRVGPQQVQFGPNGLGGRQSLIRVVLLGDQLAPYFRRRQPDREARRAKLRIRLAAFPSTMAVISCSRFGRWSSLRLRPRNRKPSTQVIP